MIFGDSSKLATREFDILHPVLREALLRLERTDLKPLAPGKYEWDGDRMFLLIQEMETAPKADKKLESHVRYIDIQYLIEGEEVIGYARQSADHIVCHDELETKDFALYEDPEEEMDLLLKPGTFAVFFPADLHRPGVVRSVPGKIKKAVVKISCDLL
jgi:YhcH/YjgK/YiaL family protein